MYSNSIYLSSSFTTLFFTQYVVIVLSDSLFVLTLLTMSIMYAIVSVVVIRSGRVTLSIIYPIRISFEFTFSVIDASSKRKNNENVSKYTFRNVVLCRLNFDICIFIPAFSKDCFSLVSDCVHVH